MGKGVKSIRDLIRGKNKSHNQSVNLRPREPGKDGDDYITIGEFKVLITKDPEVLKEISIPEKSGESITDFNIAQHVVLSYIKFSSDINNGSHLSPTFKDAVWLPVNYRFHTSLSIVNILSIKFDRSCFLAHFIHL